jgi:putative nucleotidyltransferase with HDIG domain
VRAKLEADPIVPADYGYTQARFATVYGGRSSHNSGTPFRINTSSPLNISQVAPDVRSASGDSSTVSRDTLEMPKSVARTKGVGEWRRLGVVLTVTLLYLGLLTTMLVAGANGASVGLSARLDERGEWVVSKLLPSGLAADHGVQTGYKVVRIDGIPASGWVTDPPTSIETDFGGARSVTVQGADNRLVRVQVSPEYQSSVYRWGFTILGLIFVFVGGPVFLKARERKAALSFYILCIASGLSLAAVSPSIAGYGWALAMMFSSLLLWSAAFASFFFVFPIPLCKTRTEKWRLFGGIGFTGLLILALYSWSISVNTDAYKWVRVLALIYMVACVVAGLARLGWMVKTVRGEEERRQLAILLLGTAFAVGPALLLSLLPSMLTGHYVVHPLISSLALGVMPLAFAYSITQYQLLGMRGFVRRSVIYLVMGFSVVLVFSFLATGLSTLLPQGWEKQDLGILAFGVIVFLLALSFGFVQKRVERFVDHFIYHDAYDYKEELLQFSSHLAAEQNLEKLARVLVERTCRLMNLSCGILLLSVDPKDETTRVMLKPRLATGGLNPEMPAMMSGPLYMDMVSDERGREEREPYLLPYMQYGEYAGLFLEKLQRELAPLGINLMYTDVPRPFYVSTGDETLARGPIEEGHTGVPLDGVQSFLGVPLWTRQKFVGVLCLGPKRTGERFTRDDVALLSTLGTHSALAIHNAQLYEMREQALLDTITALAHAIEAKDTYTINHCEKITDRAVALAQRLGLPQIEVENIRLASILHDVGKIGVPDAILNKPGKLTDEEYEQIKEHAVIGARIVQSVGALQGVVPIVRHHQERYDGSGYPEGLRREAIPLGARIISVVDAYGAMTEDRIYRKAPGHEVAIAELKRHAGTQFDPEIAEAFIKLLEAEPELTEKN